MEVPKSLPKVTKMASISFSGSVFKASLSVVSRLIAPDMVCLTASVLCGLISTPITSLPMRVRLSAMARPRFPNPITKYFILYSLCYINIFSCG